MRTLGAIVGWLALVGTLLSGTALAFVLRQVCDGGIFSPRCFERVTHGDELLFLLAVPTCLVLTVVGFGASRAPRPPPAASPPAPPAP